MNFDFTQGKWEYNENISEIESDLNTICLFFNPNENENLPNAEANACLISCAPEMLMALIENIKNYDFEKEGKYYDSNIESQRKIVEKATNKSWSDII